MTDASQLPSFDELLTGFRSPESIDAWKAAWTIIRANDAAWLDAIAPRRSELAKTINHRGKGGGVIDQRIDLNLAVEVLRLHAARKCRCLVYTETERLSPTSEATAGFVRVTGDQVHADLWEHHFDVTCISCGKAFLSRQIDGYHYPWWTWEEHS